MPNMYASLAIVTAILAQTALVVALPTQPYGLTSAHSNSTTISLKSAMMNTTTTRLSTTSTKLSTTSTKLSSMTTSSTTRRSTSPTITSTKLSTMSTMSTKLSTMSTKLSTKLSTMSTKLSTANTSSTTISTTSTAAPTVTGLSLTQQLMLAPLAVDRYALLNDSQFVFDFNMTGQAGLAGELITANRETFPALVGTGSGMVVGRFGPCGMNLLHVHPRGTELQIVVEGRLVTAMVPENGLVDAATGMPRVIENVINTLQMTPFYQGAYHVQYNPDCINATFVAAFNNEDFGKGDTAGLAFALSNDVLAATFGQVVSGADLETVRGALPASIARGVEECLAKCGIDKK